MPTHYNSRDTVTTFHLAAAISEKIKHIPLTDVISATQRFCVVITPSNTYAEEALCVLGSYGHHGMLKLRGHFTDCFYIIVPYN